MPYKNCSYRISPFIYKHIVCQLLMTTTKKVLLFINDYLPLILCDMVLGSNKKSIRRKSSFKLFMHNIFLRFQKKNHVISNKWKTKKNLKNSSSTRNHPWLGGSHVHITSPILPRNKRLITLKPCFWFLLW